MEKINATPDPFCAWLAMCLEDRKIFLLQRTEIFQTQGTRNKEKGWPGRNNKKQHDGFSYNREYRPK